MTGTIVSIHIARTGDGELTALQQAQLKAGKGIVGDRNYSHTGTEPEKELTLVEAEQIERFNTETGLNIDAGNTRRNIVTRGVSLNTLVGEEFTIGAVKAKGVELCQPCRYLGDLLAADHMTTPKIVAALRDRAGLRARIPEDGKVCVGHTIAVDV